jgi:hypothetical protein
MSIKNLLIRLFMKSFFPLVNTFLFLYRNNTKKQILMGMPPVAAAPEFTALRPETQIV